MQDFEKYKTDLISRQIHLTYDEEDDIVFGMGKNPENMFYPEEYKLYSGPANV